jgi:hypothetical protein
MPRWWRAVKRRNVMGYHGKVITWYYDATHDCIWTSDDLYYLPADLLSTPEAMLDSIFHVAEKEMYSDQEIGNLVRCLAAAYRCRAYEYGPDRKIVPRATVKEVKEERV